MPSSTTSKSRGRPGASSTTSDTLSSSSSVSSVPKKSSPLNPARSILDSSPTPPATASSPTIAHTGTASSSKVFSDSPQSTPQELLSPPAQDPSDIMITKPQLPRARPRGQSTSTLRDIGGDGQSDAASKASKQSKHASIPVSAIPTSVRRDLSVDHITRDIDSNHDAESHLGHHLRSGIHATSIPSANLRGRSISLTPRLEPSKPRSRSKSKSRSHSNSPVELPGSGKTDVITGSGMKPGEGAVMGVWGTGSGFGKGAFNEGERGRGSGEATITVFGGGDFMGSGGGLAVGSRIGLGAAANASGVSNTSGGGGGGSGGASFFTLATAGSVRSLSKRNSGGWGEERGARPWQGPGSGTTKRKETVPEEQTEGWLATRDQVAKAARSILGTAGDITHELLTLSVEVLDFVPVPGLQVAVKTLLQIWDALQEVDLNRMACLSLVQDCASTLLGIRDEILEAGVQVTLEMEKPFAELNGAFEKVLQLLEKIAKMSFLKRYIKRDDITRQITGCHAAIDKAVARFDNSVTLRVLKHVMSNKQQSEETQKMLDKIVTGELPLPRPTAPNISPSPITPVSSAQSHPSPPPAYTLPSGPGSEVPRVTSPGKASDVLETLKVLRSRQYELDHARDMADLRSLMKAALSAGSDADMITILQVGRDSMPEAIKALQRELEREVEKESLPPPMGASAGGGEGATALGLTLTDTDAKQKNVRRVSVTQVPVQVPLKLDEGGNVVLEDVIESPVGTGTSETHPPAGITPSGTGTEGSGPTAGTESGEENSVPIVPSDVSGANLGRSRTVVSIESADSSYSEGMRAKDTLDREFMESGIDALRRMSKGLEKKLPSWTITDFEIDMEELVGVGYYSSVYRGNWRNRTAAIKVLHKGASRSLFIREVEIWKGLKHSNVLKLYGASSTTADPPWFFVSPYAKNGSLVQFLAHIAAREREAEMLHVGQVGVGGGSGAVKGGGGIGARGRNGSPNRGSPGGGAGIGGWRMLSLPPGGSGSGGGVDPKETDLLRFMHEIAKGMEYLHSHGVLHGDLKAANVLVNDRIHCVITDFGQSEMKSEAFRMSGAAMPHGTLRWQAPELMQGASTLTVEMDVYSFAITCIEILNMGKVPWQLMDDESVRFFVLKENGRPPIPPSKYATPALEDLLREAWNRDPFKRPPFSKLVQTLKQIRKSFGNEAEDVISPSMSDQLELDPKPRPSPDMHPVPLPNSPPRAHVLDALGLSPVSSENASYQTARDGSSSPPPWLPEASSTPHRLARSEESITTDRIMMPEPVIYGPASYPHSRASSEHGSTTNSPSEENINILHYDGYDTPPPLDERLKQLRNERRYRMLLTHEFHPSLTLPLWNPSPVVLGAVGYLLKPKGSFVTLFNAMNPFKSAGIDMASLKGYGDFSTGKQRRDKRSVAQRGFDTIASLFKIGNNHARRYSFPLRAGHRSAYLCAETTLYQFFEDLETPKKWFKANVDTILELYGTQHDIQKEDLYLVIGTLSAPDYALFVCHSHPNGQAHFSVNGAQKTGKPWGTFTTDTELPQEIGPLYHEAEEDSFEPQCASKVSIVGDGPWDTLLLAKLRFKPDAADPTSL